MSQTTETRKCGRCLALENLLGEFELSESEVARLKAGEKIPILMDALLYERIQKHIEK